MKKKIQTSIQNTESQSFTSLFFFKKNRLISPAVFLFFFTTCLFPYLSQANDTLRIDITPEVDSVLVCSGNIQVLTAQTSPLGQTITWSPNDGSINIIDNNSVEVIPQQSGWYYAQTTQDTCTAIDSIFLDVVLVDLSIDPVPAQCTGGLFELKATANVPGEYLWESEELTESLEGQQVEAEPSDTTIYTLIFTAACGVLQEEIQVLAAENPEIGILCFTPTDSTLLIEGFEATLTADTGNVPGQVLEWSTGETETRIVVFPSPPESMYSLTVSYPNGCSRTVEKSIEAFPAAVKMPNAFTPELSTNNLFRPVFQGQAELLSFVIYNRWGKEVYNSINPNGWNGNVQGKPAASDVYIYRVEVEMSSGERQVFQGNVSLIR